MLITRSGVEGRRDEVRGDQRSRGGRPTEFVSDDAQVSQPIAADGAAAVVFRYDEGCPTKFRTLPPVIAVEPSADVASLSLAPERSFRAQEFGRALAQKFPIRADVNVHRLSAARRHLAV